ncbi:MAG: L-asparaginase [Burkholderia sp.]|jgi:L-asparaginase
MALPKVAVLATGGTIVSSGESAVQMTGYSLKGLSVNDVLGTVPGIADVAQLECREVANIDSSSMTSAVWMKLAKEIMLCAARDDIAGIVVTHGTDTMEETAYFLGLVLKTHKPVVLTGAMRPATALSADGPLNLLNAVRVAADPNAAGRGVLIVFNDVIGSARDTAKVHPTNAAAFRGPDLGMLGMIAGEHIEFIARTDKLHTMDTPFTVSNLETYMAEYGELPRVDIIYSHVDDDGVLVKAALRAGAQGIVYAGTGNGSVPEAVEPALNDAALLGTAVVRATRTGAGMTVEGLERWQKAGFIPAGTLSPQKARVLLQLALTRTQNAGEIAELFRRF